MINDSILRALSAISGLTFGSVSDEWDDDDCQLPNNVNKYIMKRRIMLCPYYTTHSVVKDIAVYRYRNISLTISIRHNLNI